MDLRFTFSFFDLTNQTKFTNGVFVSEAAYFLFKPL